MSEPKRGPGRPKKTVAEIAVAAASGNDGYREKMEKNAARARAKGEAARNIGRIPDPKDPVRRESCRLDLARFLLTYQSAIFCLPFCPDQVKAIRKIEEVVLDGGTNALGMPRAQGKTSICRGAALWGEAYGHRRFTVLVGATDTRAKQSLLAIKRQVQNNHLFGEDFPEICYPISRLERITIRANAQIYEREDGEVDFTDLTWGTDELVFPVIAGAKSSGAIITAVGITGDVLGQLYPIADAFIRPDLVICDDPQTFESANSLSQVEQRERIILADILGLGGPGKKISCVMPITCKRKGDLADRFLSPKIHPAWNGTRTKMVYAWPVNKDLWDKYRAIRTTFDPDKDGDQKRAWREATEFYIDRQHDGWGGDPNSVGMDTGAIVAWPERYDPDEVSAIQNAMNLRIDRGDEAFFSEFQNDPLGDVADDTMMKPEAIARKINGIPRGIVPERAAHVTAFIDVQETLLYYCVMAWETNFTGYVVDYGTWPDQRRGYFRLREADRTIQRETGVAGQEAQTYRALETLAAQLLEREWPKQGGAIANVAKCLIDSGDQTDVVYQFCRNSRFKSIVTPSQGKGIRAKDNPMGMWAKKPQSIWGPLPFWVEQGSAQRPLPHIIFDTNFWKSFVHVRLNVAMPNAGNISIFGEDDILRYGGHRMFADHLTAEIPTVVEANGRKVAEWSEKPNTENHWLDCFVGNAVAASRLGVVLAGHAEADKPSGKRTSWAEMQAKAKARAGR